MAPRLSRPDGMHPPSWLPPSHNSHRLVRLLNEDGMSPVSRLSSRWSDSRFVRRPRLAGTWPVSKLSFSASARRPARAPNSSGIEPVSRLWFSSRDWRLTRLPSSAGIEPARRLPARFRFRSPVRSPSSAGIFPVSTLGAACPTSEIPRTRAELASPPTPIPCQSSRGSCGPHFNEASPASASLVRQRTMQSATNSGFSSGSAMTMPLEQGSAANCAAAVSDTNVKDRSAIAASPIETDLENCDRRSEV